MIFEPSVVGDNIRKTRILNGISQSVLGSLLGVTKSYICSIEKGKKNPSLKTLKKISEVLKVSVNVFFKNDENEDIAYSRAGSFKINNLKDKLQDWDMGLQKKWSNFLIDEEKNFYGSERIKQIEEILKKYLNDKNISILDSSCGTGIIVDLLVSKGFKDIVAFDTNSYLVGIAKKRLSEKMAQVRYKTKTLLEIEPGVFDVVFNLGTSIGHANSDNKNYRNISNIGSLVKPGGILIIEAVNPMGMLMNFELEDVIKFEDKIRKYQRFYDYRSSTSIEKVEEVYLNNQKEEYFTSARLFFPHELVDFLSREGFVSLDICNEKLESDNIINSRRLWYFFKKKYV